MAKTPAKKPAPAPVKKGVPVPPKQGDPKKKAPIVGPSMPGGKPGGPPRKGPGLIVP